MLALMRDLGKSTTSTMIAGLILRSAENKQKSENERPAGVYGTDFPGTNRRRLALWLHQSKARKF